MVDNSTVNAFLDAYRLAFESFDVPAILDQFSYPCQITSAAGEITVTVVPAREAWLPPIERLIAAYRAIGVRSAQATGLGSIELAPGLAVAGVRWSLLDSEGQPLYDFDGAYTLADRGDGLRIVAIAHNEAPKLSGMLARRHAGA
jgi:hypothetical protein